jgi:nicotinate-nucleotide adenylyltransferase
MRVGLFCGSFNPIHLGHLRAAEEVREVLELELVYFIPAASPRQKQKVEDSPSISEDRLRMVQLAIKGNRHFMVSDAGLRVPDFQIVETVDYFRSTVHAQAFIFLIMGSDRFAALRTRQDSNEIVGSYSIIVHSRSAGEKVERLPGSLAFVQRLGYVAKSGYYLHPSGQTLTFVTTTYLPIASSDIRERLQKRKSVRYLVPVDVLDYIERRGLYR